MNFYLEPFIEVASKTHPGDEQRKQIRYPCLLTASSRSIEISGGLHWQARVWNLSTGGICLVLGRRFEPGTLLMVMLESRADEFALTMLARVVRATPLQSGAWILGCAFTHELYEDEVKALVRSAGDRASKLPPGLTAEPSADLLVCRMEDFQPSTQWEATHESELRGPRR